MQYQVLLRLGGIPLLTVVLAIACPRSAVSGQVVTSSTYGTVCANYAAQIGAPLIALDYVVLYVSQDDPPILTTSYQYAVRYEPNQSPAYCGEAAISQLVNDPTGPQQGTRRQRTREEVLDLLRGNTGNGTRNRSPSNSDPSGWRRPGGGGLTNPCPATSGQNRGSLWGFSLTENSPDYNIFLTEEDYTGADFVTIPFLVEAKGDEDWLEFAVNNTVFFKESLAGFTAGEWYEADVPLALLAPGTNVWTYYLNSAGEANSSIFLPMAVVPVPAAAWLLAGALGALAFVRRR